MPKTIIEFFHECRPPTATAQHRRHTRTGATYQPADAVRASATLRAIFERHTPTVAILGPVTVSLLWTYPHPRKQAGNGVIPKATRPDLDNLAKLALDAMTAAGYWKDDAQVVDLRTAKFCGDLTGIAVTVVEVAP